MGILSWFNRDSKKKKELQEEKEAFFASMPALEEPFALIDGRRILKDSAYMLPKDMGEVSRLDFQHFIFRTFLQVNYLAPLQEPGDILDVGCGTGRWCYEMAEAFPQARVVGCDLAELESGQEQRPSNYRFERGDVLKGLPFPKGSFDYVHQRALILAIPTALWSQNMRELVRLTRPGGWVEVVEGSALLQNGGEWSDLLCSQVIEASRMREVDPSQMPNLAQHMQEAGLNNVTAHAFAMPMGHWGGRLGSMISANMVAAARAIKPLVVQQLGTSDADFEQVITNAQEEWERLHTCAPCYVAYGQRAM